MPDMQNIIFTVGSGHCGSTLLDLMLDSHSAVFAAGELIALDREKSDKFWQGTLGSEKTSELDIIRSKTAFLTGRKRFFALETGHVVSPEEYCRVNVELFSSMQNTTGAHFIVDSSKNIHRAEALSECSSFSPYWLHIVRDGRGVTWSYLKKYPHKKLFALTKWFLSNLKVEIARLRWGGPYLLVRYEDLVHAPERELQRIARFLRIPYEEAMLHFREYEHHLVGGNRMKERSTEISEDTAWRTEMPARYRFAFAILFGWLNWWYAVRRA